MTCPLSTICGGFKIVSIYFEITIYGGKKLPKSIKISKQKKREKLKSGTVYPILGLGDASF